MRRLDLGRSLFTPVNVNRPLAPRSEGPPGGRLVHPLRSSRVIIRIENCSYGAAGRALVSRE